MKKLTGFVGAASIILMFLLLCGCAGGRLLRTQVDGDVGKLTGKYTVILYQDGSYDRLKTIAFLVPADGGYRFMPDAPDVEYFVIPNMDAQEAFRSALGFISRNRIYMSSQISSIIDPAGKTIGYEVRPLYEPLNYGVSDLMRVSYIMKEGKTVRIDIDLDQAVINRFLSDN